MDTSIAPIPDVMQGADQMLAYRRYLEQNTGDRLSGQGPSVDDDDIAPSQGAGPSIAPVRAQDPGAGPSMAAPAPTPQAGPTGPQVGLPPQPQSAQIAPVGNSGNSDTPYADAITPNPLIADQGVAPLAPQAAQAPKAKKADKARGAKQAEQAPQAPSIDGNGGAAPDLGDAQNMTPASGHVVKGKTTADGKPLINVQPPDHDPSDFDPDKLKDAHTIADVFDALPKNKQSTYMDWWEQQHGDINQRYDQMRQDLGARPDPNRDPTRKEKFTMLMNFGLNLLQNNRKTSPYSSPDPFAAAGQSAAEAIATQKQRQQQQTSDYDARVAGIEQQRQNQLKDIGNYGQAVREDAMIQNANTRTALEAIKYLKPPKTGQPTTRILSNGTQVDYDPDTKTWNPSVDKNGNPIGKMPLQGPKGGMSKAGMGRTQELDDLINNKHIDPNEALNRVFPNSGARVLDPTKTFNQVYALSRRQFEDEDSATAEAQRMTELIHGPNWQQNVASRGRPAIPPKPPAQPPPPGKIGTDAQGYKWRNVDDKSMLVQ